MKPRMDQDKNPMNLHAQENAIDILNTIPAACYELNKDGDVIFMNKKALELFSKTWDEVRGRNIWDLFPEAKLSGCYYAIQENALDKGISAQHDYLSVVLHKWISLSATPSRNGCVVLFTEVDDVRKARQEMKAQQRQLESLNTELKTLSHIAANDYNETLRQLYTNLEYIATHDASQLSNTGRANIRRAQSAIQKLKLQTDDIVSYLNLQTVELKQMAIDLNKVLEKTIAEFNTKIENLQVNPECDHLPHVNGYPTLLSLLLRHLLENAVKFRNPDVELKVRVTCRESVTGEQVNHHLAHPGEIYHVISFSDNGVGFPAEEAENIFGMFYRLHDKLLHRGSGIGLAISKKIMDIHGGFITAESNSTGGSSFHCYFPLVN